MTKSRRRRPQKRKRSTKQPNHYARKQRKHNIRHHQLDKNTRDYTKRQREETDGD